MPRDDFSRNTVDLLGRRVGARCSNPRCRKLTTGPQVRTDRVINIGVAAHITAAAEGGPRFDASLSAEERQAPDNGIWLCQNCAKLVDNDIARYPVVLLRQWKDNAEAAALDELEGRAAGPPADDSAEIELSYRVERSDPNHHEYELIVTLRNLGTEPLGPYHIDLELPAVVAHRLDAQVLYVRNRSSRRNAFFRLASDRDRPREVIYPGDERQVMSVYYHMDHDLYFGRGDLFEQPVNVTLYRRGYQPVSIERPFREFQHF